MRVRGFSEKWPKVMVACGLMIALSVGPVLAEGGGKPADQTPPAPTAAQQVIIDRDNGRHFGDSPADGGPMAKLSPALRVNDVDKAVRKVADWELSRSQPYFDSIWTWSALYVGFLAATRATGDPQYRDAVQAYAVSKDWQLRAQAPGHLPNADDQSLGQAYIGLYELDHDQKRIAATRTALDALVANPDAGVVPGKFIPSGLLAGSTLPRCPGALDRTSQRSSPDPAPAAACPAGCQERCTSQAHRLRRN